MTRVPRVWWAGPTTAPVVVGAANPIGFVVVGVVAFAARYALTGAIENDHFVTFARAVQLLYGD